MVRWLGEVVRSLWWLRWLWFGHGADRLSLTISHHKRAPNSGGRTLGSRTPGVPAAWASTSRWTEAEKWRHDRHDPPPHRHSEDLVDELKLHTSNKDIDHLFKVQHWGQSAVFCTLNSSSYRCTPTSMSTTLSTDRGDFLNELQLCEHNYLLHDGTCGTRTTSKTGTSITLSKSN